MISAALLEVLANVAAKAFVSKMASKGAEVMLDLAIKETNLAIPQSDRQLVRKLLDEDDDCWYSLTKLIPQFKFSDRRGVVFIGPSGSGKTRIMESISKKAQPDNTTSELDTGFATIAGRVTAIHDLPGQVRYFERISEELRRLQPRVIVLVMCDGYLHSRIPGYADDALLHPDFVNADKTPKRWRKPSSFLSDLRKHECNWISALAESLPAGSSKYARHLVLFANKMDIWGDSPQQDYCNNQFKQALDSLASRVAVKGTVFQHVAGAVEYGPFKKQISPSPAFDADDCLASIRAFKAFLAGLLLEGRMSR